MALMSYAATSRAPSQELGSFARQQVFCMNSLPTFAATWTLSLETKAAGNDAASQTGASSMVRSTIRGFYANQSQRTRQFFKSDENLLSKINP
ncbi:hypothetical protein TNCV_4383231 [Trichonephila clavipes]|nr:hypothetical protein TNCV_4383231 [Trichonephila clavipes]